MNPLLLRRRETPGRALVLVGRYTGSARQLLGEDSKKHVPHSTPCERRWGDVFLLDMKSANSLGLFP